MGVTIFAIVVAAIAVIAALVAVSKRQSSSPKAIEVPVRPAGHEESTDSLKRQIAGFEAAGLQMNPGITIDDILYSYPASEYAGDPYRLLLFVYGSEVEREPRGRRICEAVLDFDYECIDGDGCYVRVLEAFSRLAGVRGLLSDLRDDADLARKVGTLTYRARGELRSVPFQIDHDWADPKAVQAILSDMEYLAGDGRTFWSSDNGQSVILVFVDKPASTRLNRLAKDLLEAPLKPQDSAS